MINSLKIGKVVYSLLSTITNAHIYPLIAENGTTYPYIIYSRESLTTMSCKDGYYEDKVMLSVKVVAATYYGGLDLAQTVREKLNLNGYVAEDMKIYCKLDNAVEFYADDSYVQQLDFEITINNN